MTDPAGPGIGEDSDTEAGEFPDRGELGAMSSDADRGGRDDLTHGVDRRATDEGDGGSRIETWLGVGHRDDGGVAATGCSPAGRQDRLCCFGARFTQVSGEIDEPGRADTPGDVDHRASGGVEVGSDGGDVPRIRIDHDVGATGPRLVVDPAVDEHDGLVRFDATHERPPSSISSNWPGPSTL